MYIAYRFTIQYALSHNNLVYHIKGSNNFKRHSGCLHPDKTPGYPFLNG